MASGYGVDKSHDLKLIPEFDGSPHHVISLRLTGRDFAVYLQLTSQER
ncbi:hypothetical protein T11_17977 [Trichinella zimbabwensis]|uniref:Uncharacterized protein n=1 Tax=Trichinella zimbabwensis TaxID=268475 RepID=A0A0V1F7K1_9BILA|nr:hypothetical protein T11_17977 [Trichinella zimbabwensis]